jgi:hypothetical protein
VTAWDQAILFDVILFSCFEAFSGSAPVEPFFHPRTQTADQCVLR